VNLEALTKWVGQIPEDVVHDMASVAPMLSILGYDPYANPPNYGNADAVVKENTFKVKNNAQLWDSKVKQLLRRDDENLEENNDDDQDNPNDANEKKT